jgi:magnesium-transporting ATPase (P-type)
LNLWFLPLDKIELKSFLALANLALVGLIVSAIGARFLYPVASREGRAVWVVAAAPVSPWLRIWQKYLVAAPPVIGLGLVLLGASSVVLQLESELVWPVLILGGWLCVQLTLMAVLLGFCFPVYRYTHLLEVSLGKGSFLFMLLAFAEIGSLVTLSWRGILAGRPALGLGVTASLPWVLAWTLLTGVCLAYALHKTRGTESWE